MKAETKMTNKTLKITVTGKGDKIKVGGKLLSDLTYNEIKSAVAKNGGIFMGKKASELKDDLASMSTDGNGSSTSNATSSSVTVEPKRGRGMAKKIRKLYADGKTLKEINLELGFTKGHYVNDVIWRVNNPGGKKK